MEFSFENLETGRGWATVVGGRSVLFLRLANGAHWDNAVERTWICPRFCGCACEASCNCLSCGCCRSRKVVRV
jgi:hypothetical protein